MRVLPWLLYITSWPIVQLAILRGRWGKHLALMAASGAALGPLLDGWDSCLLPFCVFLIHMCTNRAVPCRRRQVARACKTTTYTFLALASRTRQVPQCLRSFEIYRPEANLHRKLFSLRDRFLGSAVVCPGSCSRILSGFPVLVICMHRIAYTVLFCSSVLTFFALMALFVHDRQP
jgi:hypothetical protein